MTTNNPTTVDPAAELASLRAQLAAIHCRLAHGGAVTAATVQSILDDCEAELPELKPLRSPGAAETPSSLIEAPAWLLKETYAVQYSPNCPKPYLVRLVGAGKGQIDLKPYAWEMETKDALGFGLTLAEAAENARQAQQTAKAAWKARAAAC